MSDVIISIVEDNCPTISISDGVYIPDWGQISNKPDFDALYYPISNPSGFVTGGGDWATTSQLSGTGAFLVSLNSETSGALRFSISGLQSQTGNYYLVTNPSGFITGDVVRPSQTGSFVTSSQTGVFYPSHNPSGYIAGNVVRPNTYTLYDASTSLSLDWNVEQLYSDGFLAADWRSRTLNDGLGSTSLDWTNRSLVGTWTLDTHATGNNDVVNLSALVDYAYPRSNPSGYVTGVDTTIFLSRSETGAFYSSLNPSGYINSGALSSYATQGYVNSASGALRTDILSIQSATGDFYLKSNPSGYVTGSVVRPSETGSFITLGQTGLFYSSSNPSGYVTGSVIRPSETGAFYASINPSGYITSVALTSYATQSYVNSASGVLRTDISQIQGVTGDFYLTSNPSGFVTGQVVRPSETGNFVTAGQTGQFYPSSNPSGYITGLDTGSFITTSQTGQFYAASNPNLYITAAALLPYATQSYVTGASGALRGDIALIQGATGIFYLNSNPSGFVTGQVVRPSETGSFVTQSQTGQFYPVSNPSGYITGIDSSNFVLKSETGAFYPLSNPSGYITGVDTSSFVLKSETGSYTGAFYPLFSNPNSYVTGSVIRPSDTGIFLTSSSLNSYATQSYANGISGALRLDIQSIQDATGSFYPSSNPSGYVTGQVVRPSDTGSFLTSSSLSSYATQLYVNSASGVLRSDISSIQGATGGFYLSSNPSGYITGFNSGLYVLASQTGDYTSLFYPLSANPSGYITGAIVRPSETGSLASTGYVQFYSYPLESNPSGYVTGDVVRPYDTGAFLSFSNITGAGTVSSYISGNSVVLSGAAGGGGITQGDADIRYYPRTGNPSGFFRNRLFVEVDFGFLSSGEGDYCSTTVSGISGDWVAANTNFICSPMKTTGADHDAEDSLLEQISCDVTSITPGSGFDVSCYAPNGTFGRYLIKVISDDSV